MIVNGDQISNDLPRYTVVLVGSGAAPSSTRLRSIAAVGSAASFARLFVIAEIGNPLSARQ